jgi:hypothetical protein
MVKCDYYYDDETEVGVRLNVLDEGRKYNRLEASPLGDGIYLGEEGAVVIRDGVFIGCFELFRDKWGGEVLCQPGELIG